MVQSERKRMWIYSLTGMMLMVTTTGFARMSYGILMPYMQETLKLTYEQAGILGTCISLGYLLMVVSSGILASRWGAKQIILTGAFLVTLSLFGLAAVPTFSIAILWTLLAGIGSAITFVPLVSFIVSSFPQARGLVLGIILSGSGIAMLVSGFIVPIQTTIFSVFSWRLSWLLFALVSTIVSVAAIFILKSTPSSEEDDNIKKKPKPFKKAILLNKEVLKIAILYFSVGIAYLIPILFQMGYMLHVGISSNIAGSIFATAGLFGIFGNPFWGICSDRLGRKLTLIIALSSAVIGAALPLIFTNIIGFLFSAIILGLTTGGLMVLIQAAVSVQVPPQELPIAVGFITFFFALGQMIGPGLAGWMIEKGEHFMSAYLFSTIVYAIGLGVSISIKFSQEKSVVQKQSVSGA